VQNLWIMTFTSRLVFCFLFAIFCVNNSFLVAQTKEYKNILQKSRALYAQEKHSESLSLVQEALKKLKVNTSQDSLTRALFHLQEYIVPADNSDHIDYLSILKKGISYCPTSESADSLKAVFYNKKAYYESHHGSNMKSHRSILTSMKLLEGLQNPNPGYLMGGYLLLSTNHSYFGNFEKARQSMRMAEDIYAKNKQEIDASTWELNGNHHRLGVIAKYRKIYMLWNLSESSKDSLTLVQTMETLEDMHRQPDFHEEERVYYSTALNHIGDWFVSHNIDSLTTEQDVTKGLQYLLKALDYVENKGYTGTPWAIKYNIAKGYTRGNQLEKADSTMTVLFRGISPTDGRRPFFLAQKALIKAKQNQKDSAILYFDQSIQKIHQGEKSLNQNYRNFKPSKQYNHTRLLLRIHEELTRFYNKDSVLRKKIDFIPYMALQQFENSYLDTGFNTKQNQQLRQIIQGVLKSKRTGLLEYELPQKTILNKFETFKNQLAWKQFYENRYTNALPELDSVKQRQVELTSLLAKAKIAQNIVQQDSLQTALENHRLYKKQVFPQLDLLSDFNFSVEELQSKLNSDELILKYIALEDALAIYQISSSQIVIETIAWTQKEKELLIDFIQSSRRRENNTELRTTLSELLVPNIDNGITNLIINPDGALFKLPFEILSIRDKLLVEEYNLRYTTNLGFIHFTPDNTAVSENVHVYAPQYGKSETPSEVRNSTSFLPGASNEAQTISTLFPSLLFNDTSLSKSKFIETSGQAKLLHLAMHAEVNEDYPEFSRLLFSNKVDNEEEHLYLEELYGLSLSADLAILSACNTGTGLEKNGHLESFQRAFTFAGVPATVASLWEVPDISTKEIMVLFYQNLKKGDTKSEALRNAKLKYQKNHKDSKLSAPYFWAGFVVYGTDTPIAEKPFSPIPFAIAIIIASPILWYRRRQLRKKLTA